MLTKTPVPTIAPRPIITAPDIPSSRLSRVMSRLLDVLGMVLPDKLADDSLNLTATRAAARVAPTGDPAVSSLIEPLVRRPPAHEILLERPSWQSNRSIPRPARR